MSSDMFVFDESTYYPADEISGSNFFTTDPISALSDSSIDSFLLQEISDDQNQKTQKVSPDEEQQSLDQITHTLFSDSPPSQQLDTLSLHQQQGHFGHFADLGNVYGENYSVIPEVKTEEFNQGFDYLSSFVNGGGESENMMKFMQRSYSSNSFEANNNNNSSKPSFLLQPRFDVLLEVQNFYPDDDDIQVSQMRRVCSTGDLPKIGMNNQQATICTSSPISSGEGSNFNNNNEEQNFKVGKYSAEERKERIDRYKAKRTLRNFNKTIKYACRKTLADNRPRIRGRFARNDETGDIPKPTFLNHLPTYLDDHDHNHHPWVDNLQEDDDEKRLGRGGGGGRFMTNFGATQLHYCSYY